MLKKAKVIIVLSVGAWLCQPYLLCQTVLAKRAATAKRAGAAKQAGSAKRTATAKRAVAKSGYKFVQKSRGNGKFTVALTGDGIRAHHQNSGVTFECFKPKWNVVAYNSKKKVYLVKSLEEFNGSFIRRTQLVTYLDYSKSLMKKLSSKKITHDNNKYFIHMFKCDNGFIAKRYKAKLESLDIGVSKEIQKFMSKLYSIPVEEGFPLSMISIKPKRKRLLES